MAGLWRSWSRRYGRATWKFGVTKRRSCTPKPTSSLPWTIFPESPEGIIAGSSNLTGAGLTQNLELNLGRFDRPIVEKATQWFDDLWDEAEPYDLAEIFEVVFQPRSPWEIFIRVLWQLYGDEVQEETGSMTICRSRAFRNTASPGLSG